jgi:hypothetical protein
VPRHVTRLVAQARRRLLHLRRASGCLDTSRGLSRSSSSTTLTTPRVRVPRHVTRLVVLLVVDYFAYAVRMGASARRAARRVGSSSTTSPTPRVRVPRHVTRLVVDYFTSAARLGASARRAARHAARRRLLQLCRASRCLGMSRGSSRDLSRRSSSTISPPPRVRVPRHIARLVTRPVVDYFAYAARPVPRHVVRVIT